jgi:fimbrial chaperone protein
VKFSRNSQAGFAGLAFFFIFFLAGVLSASAFSLSPMSLSFSPSGENTIQSFRLTNTSTDAIAVKVSVVSRQMAIDGTETLEPADNLFVIYPSRVMLGANVMQVVKVQWKGPPDISIEQNFRIVAEQLPVDFGGQKVGNIRILLRYMGSLYITPPNAAPNVVLDSVEQVGQELSITLYNKGNAHVLMSNLTLEVRTSEWSKTYSSEELKGFNGENMLAGLKRTFVVSLPSDVKESDYRVAFHFDPIR